MRDNYEVIRHTEDYVDPDKHRKNIEDDDTEQYQETITKNGITDDEEGKIPDDIQSEE